MDKSYNHKLYEEEIYRKWEKSGAFKAKGEGEPYTILMPPPNANASLHAGHAMYTIDDIMVRWKRMQGYNATWIPGMDHAGFETQYVYEKHLAKNGKSRMDFDRQTLYRDIFNFVQENSGLIYKQFKRLGFSADWDRSVFTLDPEVLQKVFATFTRLEKEGGVYRDEYLVNFCINCGTSLAELEVEHIERTDPLYYIRYPLADGEGHIEVATVRPETMFGDTAVAVNPKDDRYKGMAGKMLKLPLTTREIPVIEDAMVDPEFGTGAVKITPAHEPNDFEAARRHGLKIIGVIDLSGKMKMPEDVSMPELSGVKAKKAREETVNKLQEEGFLVKIDENYQHTVTTCYKCHKVLEPTIVPNWFIKVGELKKPAIEAVEKDRVKFYPKRFKKHILDWLNRMHDWPISRQIVWGIKIPVWYEVEPEKENIYVWWLDKSGQMQQGPAAGFLKNGTPLSEIEAGLQKVYAATGKDAPKYTVSEEKPDHGKTYLPETDTFDTWFSSGQWPLVTLKPEEFETRYPTDFMGTLSDILPFWISRMIIFGLYDKNDVPFKNVYLWSMVADAKGVKMSKSKGNVINPIELVDKYGADALRMSLVYGVAPGSKIPLAEDKVKGMRNFANKIWNMGRFIQLMFENYEKEIPFFKEELLKGKLKKEDKIIIDQLYDVIKKAKASLEKYRFSDAAEAIYEFMWHQLADVYIENVKNREDKETALSVVRHMYLRGLRLLHPFMPFVTEAVWEELSSIRQHPENMLITSKYPSPLL